MCVFFFVLVFRPLFVLFVLRFAHSSPLCVLPQHFIRLVLPSNFPVASNGKTSTTSNNKSLSKG